MVFPSYRQQGILIARGYPIVEMINQIYSNRADKLKGRQLPIMYSSRDHSFFTISGNLATQCPQAPAGRWRARSRATAGSPHLDRRGIERRGRFPRRLTFAAVYNAPVVFNVVNNQWAISSFSGFAGASARPLPRAQSAMASPACGSTATMRWPSMPRALGRQPGAGNQGPTLIEHFTYRAEGHSTSDDPSAPTALRRSARNGRWAIRSTGSRST
jgi:2-oxoisovalerate dehydrogenase E1 component alpha subunit